MDSFNAPKLYVGSDLLKITLWLESIADRQLPTKEHGEANYLYRIMNDMFEKRKWNVMEVYPVEEWEEWVEECIELHESLKEKAGDPEDVLCTEEMVRPEIYSSNYLFDYLQQWGVSLEKEED